MALITCVECSKEVSDKAMACLKCGYPMNEIIKTSHQSDENQIVTNKVKLKNKGKNIIPFAVITVCVLILSFVFILPSIPSLFYSSNANEKILSQGKQILEITDNYLDSKITARDANDKINLIYYNMSAEDGNVDDFGIVSGSLIISTKFTTETYDATSESYNKILEERNKLAGRLGMKKR